MAAARYLFCVDFFCVGGGVWTFVGYSSWRSVVPELLNELEGCGAWARRFVCALWQLSASTGFDALWIQKSRSEHLDEHAIERRPREALFRDCQRARAENAIGLPWQSRKGDELCVTLASAHSSTCIPVTSFLHSLLWGVAKHEPTPAPASTLATLLR